MQRNAAEAPSLRLARSGIHAVGREVAFTYDGRELTARLGETIAAALAAQGVREFRQTRSGKRRGLYCGMGACYDCLVTVDGRANQRACLTKVAQGQVIRSDVPKGDRSDPLRALVAEPAGPEPDEESPDILVIGAGPAGLSAALAAARRGAKVVVLDERPQSGGQFYKPLAPSHVATSTPDRQFSEGAALLDANLAAGVELVQEALVWGAHAADEVVAIVAGRAVIYRPRRLIVAPGAYERPTPFPGWTLPGVMTTGAAQTLARAYRIAPGRRIVIAGNGPLNLQLACELLDAGVKVLAVLETARKPGPRLWRQAWTAARAAPDLMGQGVSFLWRLRRAGVPVLWSCGIVAAVGTDRLQSIKYAPIDRDGYLAEGAAIDLDVDALCVGMGFIPSTEIARGLGIRHSLVGRHLGYLATDIGRHGETDLPGVQVVGDGADLGGARAASARGTLAGIAAATALGLSGADLSDAARAEAELDQAVRFQEALWSIYETPPVKLDRIPDSTVLCRCEDISFGEVRQHIAQGHDTLASLKRNLRLGMGRCQGRYCASTAALILEQMTGRAREPEQFFAPRLPVKPAPALALAFEKPEWGAHQRSITPNLARSSETARVPDLEADTLVVGGGVVGACLAYYLSREGVDVLVVERDDVNLQASGANAGSLHVQLLSFDFGPKAEAGGGPAAATLPLGPLAIAEWRALERDCADDFEIRITGGLMLADSPHGMAFLEAKAALERAHGIQAEIIGAAELRRLAPNVSPAMLGAEFAPQEGKINPLRATYAVLAKARERGARFLRGANVTAIERSGNGWRIATSRCDIRAGRIVNAAGPWARETGRMVGIDVPVHSAPLQMIVTEPAPRLVDHLIAHADRHLSLKQVAAGGIVIGGAWTAAFDPRRRFNVATRRSIEGNLWVANHVLPQLAGLHVIRSWAAMNINIDGAPIVGPVPGLPGFFNTVTSNGYTLAPIVARVTADMMLRGRTDIDVGPYLIDRFA